MLLNFGREILKDINMIFLYTILTIVTTLLILFYLRYIGIQEENKLKEEKKEKALVKEIEEYKKIIDFEKTSIEFKEEIKKINRECRNIDKVTDVISFAFEDNEEILYNNIRVLGDIYICIPRMLKQARDYGHSEKRELSFLTVHGLLHLLGYDHISKSDEEKMFALQELILNGENIKR